MNTPSLEPERILDAFQALSPFRRAFMGALVVFLQSPVSIEDLRREQAAVNRSLQAAIDELERQQTDPPGAA